MSQSIMMIFLQHHDYFLAFSAVPLLRILTVDFVFPEPQPSSKLTTDFLLPPSPPSPPITMLKCQGAKQGKETRNMQTHATTLNIVVGVEGGGRNSRL